MERIVAVNWTVLCVSIILLFEIVSSVPHDNSHQGNIKIQRDSLSKLIQPYFWFAPRLGRKKRNSRDNDFYENTYKKEMASLMDIVGNTPWDIMALNEGKRHVVNYTPRLGRESGEDLVDGRPNESQWLEDPTAWSEKLLSQRSPPFAPRLGRRLSSLYSRLERENDKMPFS